MKNEGRSFIAIALCVVFYLGYSMYLQKKYPDMNKKPPVTTETTPASQQQGASSTPSTAATETSPPAVGEAAPQPAARALSPEELRVETQTMVVTFDQEASAITSVKLKNYDANQNDKGDGAKELLDSPLIVQASRDFNRQLGVRGFQAERQGDRLVFKRQEGHWAISHEFVFNPSSYSVEVNATFVNQSGQPEELNAGLFAQTNVSLPPKTPWYKPAVMGAHYKKIISAVNGDSSKEEDLAGFCQDAQKHVAVDLRNANVDFVGIDDHYFLRVLEPLDKNIDVSVEKAGAFSAQYCSLAIKTQQRMGLVGAGGEVTLHYKAYFGPKDMNVLASHDAALKKTVNYGIFGILAKPLLSGIEVAFRFTRNYGLAIILVTFFLKMLFYPLTRKAAVSMRRMQKLQPELQRIRERYKDDPQTLQREMMKFMSTHKANPFQGCLPILPQIPVFIAFYNVLSQSIELRHAPFFGWIQDLSMADPYYITPALLALAMFLQQRLTPTPTMDKAQERIMMMMPIIFSLMMLSLPAGMVLYMITNTVVSIAQQQWLNRRLDAKAT